jgi:DNA-binding MarR family transcriptional regulator
MTSFQHDQPAEPALDQSPIDAIERTIVQISWLSQRQLLQVLDEDRFHLTLPQFYTLLQLDQTGELYKMSDLAEATHQSPAALTGVVDRLCEKQLVERTRHERDRRQVMVLISALGRTRISEIRQARRERFKAALAHLSDQEIDRLFEMLDRVLAGMARVLESHERGSWA